MRRFTARLSALGFVVLLSGCSTTVKVDATPSPDDYNDCFRPGTGSLAGEVFATTTSGEVKLGAGVQVYLDEMTSYSSACFKALKAAGDLKAETADETFKFDRVMLNCRKTVIADSQGRFKFERVRSGKYWVSAYIRWRSNRGFWTGGWVVSAAFADGTAKTGLVVR